MPTSSTLLAQYVTALDTLLTVSKDVAAHRCVDDETLMLLGGHAARLQQLAGMQMAVVAGEVARRSDRSLGHKGLAQREGFRSPEAMMRASTGLTYRDASTAVRVGTLMNEAALAGSVDAVTGEIAPEASQPWLAPVARAAVACEISPSAAEAIRNGLGEPSDEVTPVALEEAAVRMLELASSLHADALFQAARAMREDMDELGIAAREQERRRSQFLRMRRGDDGMLVGSFRLCDENAALMTEIYDRATSPRRGGPRFVNEADKALADRVATDPRTTEQMAADVFVHLLGLGANADRSAKAGSRRLLGVYNPSVRVLVTENSLTAHRTQGSPGHGRLEGQAEAVSIATVERMICSGSVVPIVFDDDGQALNLGREQRLFSKHQRIALAARDGGCRWDENCDRPPSWTEAHHILHWARDHGPTNLEDGLSLCQFHHNELHANGWEIEREGGTYWLIPAASIDPAQTRRLMPTHSRALLDLMREQRAVWDESSAG